MSGEREPWIAVRTGIPESSKIIELPSDAARWGLIVLWCKAKKQTPSGVFRSEKTIRAMLGKHARYLTLYVAAGFLHVAPVTCSDRRCQSAYLGLTPSAYAVHSWHDHQRDHALRQLAYRVGEDLGAPASDTASDVSSRAVSLSPSWSIVSPPTEGGPGETNDDPVSAYYDLTGRYPRDTILSWLKDLEASFGARQTSAMLATCYTESRNLGTLLGRVKDRLAIEAHAADRRERSDEIERNRQKRRQLPDASRELLEHWRSQEQAS